MRKVKAEARLRRSRRRRRGGQGHGHEHEQTTARKERRKTGRVREERKGQTRRKSPTRWSDSHVLLAVHDEAPHRLAIWIVGSSLTYCG